MGHAIGGFVGIGVHEDGIDDAENRRRRADSECERNDRGEREPGQLDELPECIAQVLEHSPHESLVLGKQPR